MVVKPLPGYKIWIQFSDGTEGEVDLSHLVGKGVFSQWHDPRVFQQVHIGSGRSIAWNDQIDLCADALYMEVTGKTPEELFQNLQAENINA